ncbi:hypothetical protein HHK36_008741 [Tetracentron sinense]|uniref:Brix domain-containing protein n=1 Tax=Tetracentron sinense TaxID=13715 RepID=A0A835DKA7_TETSI|nr:hypothetical protein HHK36_008741 [Tetracentron sinense]
MSSDELKKKTTSSKEEGKESLKKKLEKRKRAKARDAAEKRALELGEEPPPKKIPCTIENTRVFDETVCMPNNEELFAGNDADEFSSILELECTPKILITTCRFNSSRGPDFIKELLSVIPNAHYYKRGTYDLKKVLPFFLKLTAEQLLENPSAMLCNMILFFFFVEYAKNKDFTSVIVVHTNRREPDALLIMGLPDGPTANFKLSRLVLRKDNKAGVAFRLIALFCVAILHLYRMVLFLSSADTAVISHNNISITMRFNE